MKRDIVAVRLTAEERRLLDEAQARLGVSRSEVVREAVARYVAETDLASRLTAAERLAPWIGKYEGGEAALSSGVSSRVRKILLAKRARRSR